MTEVLLTMGGGVAGLLVVALNASKRRRNLSRTSVLWSKTQSAIQSDELKEGNEIDNDVRLGMLEGRLGRAGYISHTDRRRLRLTLLGLGGSSVALCMVVAGPLVGSVAGLYLGVVASVLHLRRTAADYERRLMFQLPLTLEALILLVESGLGILPALEQLVSSKGNSAKNNPVIRILGLVYRLASNGIPFSRAASMVANSIENRAMRHVLLHLELSRSEGGSIGASLRSLSDHAHNEWKASVETRVKRLENQVIFPVFGCVIGLMVLVSAVPLVSIKDFSDRLDKSADARVVKDKEFQPRN